VRFTGQIRVPEVDHPGVPATFVVDDNQAEVVLEGDSLGRWSLFDVHVNRLVSSAFQVDLAGEEITFIADEPVDFAYKGVEHMAEVWARYKTMAAPRRLVAVKRSRKGTTPSRIQEFKDAMVENLQLERTGTSEPSRLAGEPTVTPVATSVAETALEPVTEANVIDERPESALVDTERKAEAERMAAEREALVEDRALLEEQRRSLEQALAKAELLEKQRLEVAQIDMDRIESETKALEERHERERLQAERLEAERRELEQLEADRIERERQQAKHLAARQQEVEKLETQKRAEADRLDEERQELERLDAERVEKERVETVRLEEARADLERVEQERAEVARLEMEKLEQERVELERLEHERLQREQAENDRAEKQRLADEKREQKRLKKEKAAAAAEAAEISAEEAAVEAAAAVEDESAGRVEELLGTSAEGDLPENAKELVVDLGAFEEVTAVEEPKSPTEPEPALAGVAEKAGIMGAVKAAFTRSGKNHVHDFTEAPGGIGMVRFICRECGYVSISSSD